MNRKLVKHVIFRLHEKIVGRKTYAFLAELTSGSSGRAPPDWRI